jgi:hypothetical protein
MKARVGLESDGAGDASGVPLQNAPKGPQSPGERASAAETQLVIFALGKAFGEALSSGCIIPGYRPLNIEKLCWVVGIPQ